jgi:transposase-like protein
MFQPPRCPNRDCPQHADPEPRFYVRNGHYRALCRSHPIPRFRCRTCRKGFSRQTFRMDYHDHRPDLNDRLFRSLASGVGLRQTSRNLGLSLTCTQLKFRKIARHLRDLDLNLRDSLPPGSSLQFDELETYEGRRNTRPLSVPVLIEKKTRYLLWAEAAPIRPRGRMSEARKRAMREDEKRYGKRKNLSARSVRRTLQRGADVTGDLDQVELYTDEKMTYPRIAAEIFGEDRLVHHRTNSKLARTTWNPLFPINHTEAMARDLTGRLRRESWLVSKKRRYLDLGLALWMAWRNYVRRRFNYDQQSPAQMLGFVDRRLTERQLLSWRQDWGASSVHPLAWGSESVAIWKQRRRAA